MRSTTASASGHGRCCSLAIAATSFARKRVFAFRDTAEPEAAAEAVLPESCFGMPALSRADRKVAAAERIPPALFYLPLVFNWMRLGLRHRSLTLPTAANPNIFTGGMWGESKSSYFFDVTPAERQWIADFVLLKRNAGVGSLAADLARAARALEDAGLDFPLIAKPDIGWHGHGVRRIDDRAQLENYIAHFPPVSTLMLQRYVPHTGEAAVLYARLPGEASGRILSLTFRYFPHVIGNGRSNVRQLIRSDERAQWKSELHLGIDPTHRGVDPLDLDRIPASGEVVRIALINNQRAGALYRDGRRHITAALEARFDGDRAQHDRIPLRPLRSALRKRRSADAGRGFLDRGNQRHRRRSDRLLGPAAGGDRSLPAADRTAAAAVHDRRAQPGARVPSDRVRRFLHQLFPAEPLDPQLSGVGLMRRKWTLASDPSTMSPMRTPLNRRRFVALLAAYVVALQALLLPLSVAAGTQFSSSLCVTLADGSHPPGSHDNSCPCAAGCGMQCCGQALIASPSVVARRGARRTASRFEPFPAIEPVLRTAGKGPQIPRAPPVA